MAARNPHVAMVSTTETTSAWSPGASVSIRKPENVLAADTGMTAEECRGRHTGGLAGAEALADVEVERLAGDLQDQRCLPSTDEWHSAARYAASIQ